MTYKIDGTTRYSVSTGGFPQFGKFGRIVYLIELNVDFGDHGYSCWGYRISEAEAAEAGPLHFNHTWTSPGQVLDEVLKEIAGA